MDKRISVIYFSPTGTTHRIAREIASGIGSIAATYDLTLPAGREQNRSLAFGPDDLVVFGVPVYAGRVPRFLTEQLRTFSGDDTLAVFVVVYGNRDYEDALRELQDTLEDVGFIGVAAGAFIGEHSYTALVAGGRPDRDDLLAAMNFGLAINARLNDASEDIDMAPLQVKGSRPYIEKPAMPPSAPETSAACTHCGLCARTCPMGAINSADETIVDASRCIRCHACVRCCPVQAKRFTHEAVERIRQSLIANCGSRRREPELFF